MDINKIKIVVFCSVILLIPSCIKECPGKNVKLNFKIGGNYTSGTDSLHLNDTLHLIFNIPVNIKDLNTNQDIDYSGAQNLGTVIAFQKLDNTNTFATNAVSKFGFQILEGIETNRTTLDIVYRFVEVNNAYRFNLSIIPKEIGVFRILLGNAANVNRLNLPCEKSFFNINVLNNDRHPELAPNFIPNGPYPEGGDYFFRVVP